MSIEKLIGNTPLVELTSFSSKPGVRIFSKLEGTNPGGSVKDRAAYGMINDALQSGKITKDSHLIEPTSGNTGKALAMIAAIKGITISLVMPESATAERIQTMRAYGAEVILTPAEGTIEYSRKYAEQLAKEKGLFSS